MILNLKDSEEAAVWKQCEKKRMLDYKTMYQEDVFVKQECPRNGQRPFFSPKTVTLIFYLDRWPELCYQQDGLVTGYTHVKNKRPNSYQSQDVANVFFFFFADKQTDRRTNGHAKNYLTPIYRLVGGHKNKHKIV